MLHHDRLKPCEDRDIPLWLSRKRSHILSNTDCDAVYDEDSVVPSESTKDRDVTEHNDYPDYSLDSLFREQPEDDLANGCGDAQPRALELDVAIPLVLDQPEEPSGAVDLLPSRFGRNRVRPRHLQDYFS